MVLTVRYDLASCVVFKNFSTNKVVGAEVGVNVVGAHVGEYIVGDCVAGESVGDVVFPLDVRFAELPEVDDTAAVGVGGNVKVYVVKGAFAVASDNKSSIETEALTFQHLAPPGKLW